MSLLQIAMGLVISGIIAAASIVGGESMIHAAKVSSIKTAILAVSQKSIEYAQINGSYNGLGYTYTGCFSLQKQNLETANGCSPTGAFESILSEGTMTLNASSGGAGYTIYFNPTDSSIKTPQDCLVIEGSISSSLTSNSCSLGPEGWSFTYGN